MRILIAAATAGELAPLLDLLVPVRVREARLTDYEYRGQPVSVLVTGVGMVATAAWCSRELTRSTYDLALNLGLCGSFDSSLEVGRVVHVVSDRIAELGAEDDDRFLTIQELGLLEPEAAPFGSAELVNARPPRIPFLDTLPAVTAITVNTAHGSDRSIAAVVERFNPQIESMEGAAFMYVCLLHGVPFAQVRAVSNVVERRNRAAWRFGEAVGALGTAALQLIEAS